MYHEQLKIKQTTAREVKLTNLLLLHQTTANITSGEQEITLNLKYYPAKQKMINSDTMYCLIHFPLKTKILTMIVDHQLLLPWVNNRFPVNSFETLPVEIGKIILQQTLSPLLDWFESQFDQAIFIKNYEITPGNKISQEKSDLFTLTLSCKTTINNTTLPKLAVVFLDTASVSEDLIHAFPIRDNKKIQAGFNYPGRLVVGILWLSIEQLQNIGPGDILLFHQSPAINCLFLFIAPSLCLQCRLKHSTLVIEQPRDILMSNDDDIFLSEDKQKKVPVDETDSFPENDFIANFLDKESDLPERENITDIIEDTNTNSDSDIDSDFNIDTDLDIDSGFDSNIDATYNEEEAVLDKTLLQEELPSREEKEFSEKEMFSTSKTIDTSQLSVLITFDVGTIAIPLHQLQTLQTGHCFELPKEAESYVTIRAHGQIIGKGELVQVGTRIGVEITENLLKPVTTQA